MLAVFPWLYLLGMNCLILPGGFDDSLECSGPLVQVNGVGFLLYCLRYRIRNSMFLRGLGSRVLELGGESGTDRHPTVYPGSYVE